MDSFFTSKFFTANRTRLRKQVDEQSVIIVTANGLMQRSADEAFAFTQDSNFWYLTGLQAPDLILVMTQDETYLIAPNLSHERQVFDGDNDLLAFSKRSGITDILDEQAGWKRLKADLANQHKAAVLEAMPTYLKRYRMHSLPYRRRLLEKLKRLDSNIQFKDIRQMLAAMRCLKQPTELQALQRAIDITGETLQEVTQESVLKSIRQEYELEAAISYGFRKRGAAGHAFQPIVGAGAHSTTLHHVDNNGPVTSDDVIVLDVGASVEHYAADITRTVSKGAFTPRQQAVFDAVAAVQDHALSLLKPGTMLRDYEHSVADYLGTQLVQLGLIKTSDTDSIRRYFPHATSHFLGLDTHDVGDYEKPLQAGMVLTCEPGIYIAEENIGVRIEDDVLITTTGNTVLSAACPRNLGYNR